MAGGAGRGLLTATRGNRSVSWWRTTRIRGETERVRKRTSPRHFPTYCSGDVSRERRQRNGLLVVTVSQTSRVVLGLFVVPASRGRSSKNCLPCKGNPAGKIYSDRTSSAGSSRGVGLTQDFPQQARSVARPSSHPLRSYRLTTGSHPVRSKSEILSNLWIIEQGAGDNDGVCRSSWREFHVSTVRSDHS
jgi:hypothetical protein